MNKPRYEKFILLIEGIQKSIRKLKLDKAPSLGVKSVHIFWLSHLLQHPEGLTAAELATESMIDRSLVSREIEALERGGYITVLGDGRRYVLTDEGEKLSLEIKVIIEDVQKKVGEGIDEGELLSFYSTLEKLHGNFEKMTKNKRRHTSAKA